MIYAKVTVRVFNRKREELRTFTLEDSGAFDYGNGTAVVEEYESGMCEGLVNLYDTRYDKSLSPKTEEALKKWVLRFVRENTRPEFGVEIVER